MTTTYSGPLAFLSDDPSFGDGDESSFNVLLSGSVTLSISADQSGNITGVGTIDGVVSGSTTTDTDGDDDAFSDSLSGTASDVSGSLASGVSAFFSMADGSASFQSTFSAADQELTGTIDISDSNLGTDIVIPVGLFSPDGPGLAETAIPPISAPAQFGSSMDSSGNWTGESQPVTFDDSTGSWTLNAFKGVYDGINFVASEAQYYAGEGIATLVDAATDEAPEAIENQIEEVSPQAASVFSNAHDALTLYQTLKSFEEDSMNLIQRGVNSIMGTDDLTPEEFDQQQTEIVNTLQTNLVSQLTGIPTSVLNFVQNYTGKIVNLFSDSTPVFETYEGSGALGGNSALTYGILGGSGDNTLEGGAANSVLFAGSGHDTLVAGAGNEWLLGGPGYDVAEFSGKKSTYTITQNADGTVSVKGASGADTLLDVGKLVFADQTVVLKQSPGTSDFNNDGLSDVLWQNDNAQDSGTGQVAVWLMNGATPTSTAVIGVPPPSWHAVATGDFNDDGKADILWQNDNGQVAIWEMNGTTPTAQTIFASPPPDWHAVATGDFNGDGDGDILWQYEDAANSGDPLNGEAAIWEMNGTTPTTQAVVAVPGANWRAVGTGDFNGDGKSDILWQYEDTAKPTDPLNGETAIWEMNGLTPTLEQVVAVPGADWHAIGTGDFNGDGKADILWQYEDGANPSDPQNGNTVIWLMNGTSATAAAVIATPGAAWHAVGTGDYDGNGKSDILWQNTNGEAAIWEMNGTTSIAQTIFASPPNSWHLIPA